MGAVTAELLTRQRGSRARYRRELERLRTDTDTAKEQALLLNAQIFALNQRVEDLLQRLNSERGDHHAQ